MSLIVCNTDVEYQQAMTTAGTKPIVVDFTASWCPPCKRIAPFFEQMSNQYGGSMVFLKVDVDECEATSAAYEIEAMPTFIVLINGEKKESVQGADSEGLEQMIKKWCGNGSK